VKKSHKNKKKFGEKITCIHVLGVEEVKFVRTKIK